jgi:valyl-tRNA synthetase
MNVDRAKEAGVVIDLATLRHALLDGHDNYLESRWIRSQLSKTAGSVNLALSEYRFDEAASHIYQFFWGDFCDWYLELVKLRLDFAGQPDVPSRTEALRKFLATFEASLRLLSPFMPFITEEIWHAFYGGNPPSKSIALMGFPVAEDARTDEASSVDMAMLQELIVTVRALRKEIGVPEKESAAILLFERAGGVGALAVANADMLAKMARVSGVTLSDKPLSGNGVKSTSNFDVQIVYERVIDVAAERERLSKDLAKYEKGLTSAERQLGNEAFMGKAPAHIVDGLRKQAAETKLLFDKTKAALDELGG